MAVPFQPGDDLTDESIQDDTQSPLDTLLGLVPAGGEFDVLRFTLQRVATSFADDLAEITPERLQNWITEIQNGDGRTPEELREDIFRHVVGVDRIMDVFDTDADMAEQLINGTTTFSDFLSSNGSPSAAGGGDDSPAPGAEGDVTEDGEVLYPGVMPGGTVVQITRPGQDDVYLMAYEHPPGSGQFISWQFESAEQLEATFGPDWATAMPREWHDQDWMDQHISVMDDIGEIIGMDVAFGDHLQNVTREAAQLSGITDPSIIGEMANNIEIQGILAVAAMGDWTEARILGELRSSDYWTQTLYPGIDSFYASGSTDPEQDWKVYQTRMEQVYRAMGVEPDAARGYRDMIGDDITVGIDPSLAEDMVPTFQRASTSPEYADVLNQWMQADLGQTLDFNTWFDVLANQAPAEVSEVVEKATLQFVANAQSLDVDASQINRIAGGTNMSEAQAAAAFEDVSAQLLALGDGLERYGLSEDDILSSQTGIEATSGRSISEIKQIARKTATELGLADDRKIQLYVGYDPTRGTPTRPGLGSLSPTGG